MKKTVLITGASKGIGRALAQKMLTEGYYVVGTSRNGIIEGFDDQDFQSIKLDLSDPASIETAQQEISSKFTRIDMLINNAGIGPDLGAALPERKSYHQTFEVNVDGTVFFTEGLIDLISEQGILLNVSSKMGSVDLCTGHSSVAYRMSKSALNMYTKILCNRLKDKIRVAAIHPGWVQTEIAPDNIANAPLTPEQSAELIYDFLRQDFASGIFWDAATGTEMLW